MKFTLSLLLLIPIGLVAQTADQVEVQLVEDHDSFPDCNTLFYANGDYRINKQELAEIKLPNTIPVEPATLVRDSLLIFHSLAQEAKKYGSIELDANQITAYSREQVLALIYATRDSSQAPWLLRDTDYLWDTFQIVYDSRPIPPKVDKDTIPSERSILPINVTSGIIDGVFLGERQQWLQIEAYNESHIPQEFVKESQSVINQIVSPKLDSILHPFYFSNYEVTNKEYREFIKWVADSIELHMAYFNLNHSDASILLNCSNRERKSLDSTRKVANLNRFGLNSKNKKKVDESNWVKATMQLYYPQPQRYFKRREKDPRYFIYKLGNSKKIAIYPDTSGFYGLEELNGYGHHLGTLNWHPVFDDYPIVNITNEQIMAFCHWKQAQLNDEYKSEGYTITVRPPTIAEYEFAAKTSLGPQGYLIANDQSNENYIPFTRNQGDRGFVFYQRVTYSPFIGRGSSDGIASLNYREWYRANQSFSPVKFLNGNVSEFVLDEVIPEKWDYYKLNSDQAKTNAHFVLGTNYINDVKTRGDDQYNAIFYKTSLGNGTSSPLIGFRLVYLVDKITE